MYRRRERGAGCIRQVITVPSEYVRGTGQPTTIHTHQKNRAREPANVLSAVYQIIAYMFISLLQLVPSNFHRILDSCFGTFDHRNRIFECIWFLRRDAVLMYRNNGSRRTGFFWFGSVQFGFVVGSTLRMLCRYLSIKLICRYEKN